MRKIAGHAGLMLAAGNVLVFALMLASRPSEYEQLRQHDARRRNGGTLEINTADPMYLAARPFYSSAHVSNVPISQDVYFVVNAPATMVMISVGFTVSSAAHELWTGRGDASLVWESWVLAMVFGVSAALWAFIIGSLVERWRLTNRAA